MDECSRAGSVQRFPELVAPFGVAALPVDEERLDLPFASLFAEVFGVRRIPQGVLVQLDAAASALRMALDLEGHRETTRGAGFPMSLS